MEKDGKIRPITKQDIDSALQLVNVMAAKGYRTLGLGVRDFVGGQPFTDAKDVETEIVFMGVLGIEDPPRKEVKRAVKLCKRAGITVRMVTGDNILTAKKLLKI